MEKTYDIESMSLDVYRLMIEFGANIFGIHKHSIHLGVSNKIITIGYHMSKGIHHIKLKQSIDFQMHDIKPRSSVYIMDHKLIIGDLNFRIDKDVIETYKPYNLKYKNTDDVDILSNQLTKMIDQIIFDHVLMTYNYNIMRQTFYYVNQFFKDQTLMHATSLLGLGPGLTPYGDDVLVGYILGKNSIGKKIEWMKDLMPLAFKKTNLLSSQNLKDTYEKMYPDIYIEMIEDIFINKKIDHAKKLMHIGDTSGIGMLIGFLHGIKEGEHKNERL